MEQTKQNKSCRDCDYCEYISHLVPKALCVHANRPTHMMFGGECDLWEPRVKTPIEEKLSTRDLVECKKILKKVLNEGLEKVSEELSMNPDYLGNARTTIDLLNKASSATKETLDMINDITYQIQINY